MRFRIGSTDVTIQFNDVFDRTCNHALSQTVSKMVNVSTAFTQDWFRTVQTVSTTIAGGH